MRRPQTHLVFLLLLLLLFALVLPGFAAAQRQVVTWPDGDHPVLRFTFVKFNNAVGPAGDKRPYVIDTTAENLSGSEVKGQHFLLYVSDQHKMRIGEGSMDVADIGPGQTVKLQANIMASGSPASIRVLSQDEAQKPVALTVNSSPQGALLKVDGVEAGTTPKLILVGQGKHQLTFSKEGFQNGAFPIEIDANDASGGSVNFQLAVSQFDTIELRDGTILNGELDSIQGMDVVVRIGDTIQRIDRNKVKRILLTERAPLATSDVPPVATKPK
jgi:hypothetical protein